MSMERGKGEPSVRQRSGQSSCGDLPKAAAIRLSTRMELNGRRNVLLIAVW
jgi:hypothetical protein